MTHEPKPYKIGYIAGVFDLFHIGHLALIRRAKQMCHHLIVGVVDEAIPIYYKGADKAPIVPLNERMAIVAAVRYVDEVVRVTFDNLPKLKAQELYRYEAYFSGDDYADSEAWAQEAAQLKEKGVDLVFFPYTKEQSSTALRAAMVEVGDG